MRKIILPCLLLLCLFNESFSQGTCATANIIPLDGSCNNRPMGPLGTSPTANFSPVTATGVTCTAYPANRRVTWYRFTPTTDILSVRLVINSDYFDGTGTTGQTQVVFYDPNNGTNCPANITSTAAGSGLQNAVGICDADGQNIDWQPSNTEILRANRTYFIRIYQNTGADNSAMNINICAYPVPIHTIPLDGSQANYAVTGPRGTGRNYNSVGGTSPQRCNYTANRRVTWFKFRPTITTSCATFNINVDENVQTEVAFFDPSVTPTFRSASTLCLGTGTGVFAPKASVSAPYTLMANQDYYLRIYTNHNHDNNVNINIQADVIIPPNDLCTSATQLDANGISNQNNVCMTGAANEPNYISSNSGTLICTPVMHNTAWYYVEVANPASSVNITISNINCVNSNDVNNIPAIQVGTLVWDGGTCSSANNLVKPSGAQTCFQGTTPSPIVIPAGTLPAGSRVYITVDGREGSNCTYTIQPNNAIPIPVKIEYFTGWKQAGKNQLKWVTVTELNNAYFEIERSSDGKDFAPIGRVDGAGNSDQTIQYKFDDLNYPEVAYYRLKQFDFDGTFEYTNVVMIKRDDRRSMLGVSFANPVIYNASRMTISTDRAGLVRLQIVDAAGRTLHTQMVQCTPGNTNVMKDLSKIPAGNYYLVLMQGDDKLVKPFIKQ